MKTYMIAELWSRTESLCQKSHVLFLTSFSCWRSMLCLTMGGQEHDSYLAGSYFSYDTVNIHKEAEMLLILTLKVLCFPMFDKERAFRWNNEMFVSITFVTVTTILKKEAILAHSFKCFCSWLADSINFRSVSWHKYHWEIYSKETFFASDSCEIEESGPRNRHHSKACCHDLLFELDPTT